MCFLPLRKHFWNIVQNELSLLLSESTVSSVGGLIVLVFFPSAETSVRHLPHLQRCEHERLKPVHR